MTPIGRTAEGTRLLSGVDERFPQLPLSVP